MSVCSCLVEGNLSRWSIRFEKRNDFTFQMKARAGLRMGFILVYPEVGAFLAKHAIANGPKLSFYLNVLEKFSQATGHYSQPGHTTNGPGGIQNFLCIAITLYTQHLTRVASWLDFARRVVV